MPLYVDLELNSQRDISLDTGGDFNVLTNYPAAVQDVAVAIDDELASLIGSSVTKRDVVKLRSLIRDALNDHEFVEDVYSVEVIDVEDEGQYVELSIAVDQNETLQFTARF